MTRHNVQLLLEYRGNISSF